MAIKHKIRDSKGALVQVELTPLKAIKKFCLECMGFQQPEIERCTAPACPLFPFRTGDAHTVSQERRNALRDVNKNRVEGSADH